MKYLLLSFILFSFQSVFGNPCFQINLDELNTPTKKISRTVSQHELDIGDQNLSFANLQKDRCVEITYKNKIYKAIAEPQSYTSIEGVETYIVRFSDDMYVSIIYSNEYGNGIFIGSESEEFLIRESKSKLKSATPSYQLLKYEIEDPRCGDSGHKHDYKKLEENYERKSEINTCGEFEYILEVGAAADFEFVTNFAGGSAANAFNLITGRFGGVVTNYGDCDMRINAQLVQVIIEPCDNCFFDTPRCWPNRGNSDAFSYNTRFASSPFRPAGDVVTLWSGQDLQGAACLGDVGGMAYLIGGACRHNRTNMCQGNGGGRLWTHEIGHNLGVGINHGNIEGPFFYGNGGPWHPNTINKIHSTINNRSCIQRIDYCCLDIQDKYVCDDRFCNAIPSASCDGNLQLLTPIKILGDVICGKIPDGPKKVNIRYSQSTSNGLCEFNQISYNVYNCDGVRPSFPYPPSDISTVCLNDFSSKCYTASQCVKSWEVINSNTKLNVTTNGRKICVSHLFPYNEETLQISIRPHYICGGQGNWANWNIQLRQCGSTNSDLVGNSGNILTDEISIFPNPIRDIININSPNELSNISIYDLSGQLVKTKDVNCTSCKVEVFDLTSGIYTVRIQSKDQTIIKAEKLVIQ